MKYSNLWQPNPPGCDSMLNAVKREFGKVQEMRGLVSRLTRMERGKSRQKRGIFNVVGHIAHSLFGMLDSDSEIFYNQKIAKLEEENLDWLKLIREQAIVVRSTLNSVNKTLHDVSTNEVTLTSQLHKILTFMNARNRKIEDKYALTALLLALNDHATRVRQAVREVKDVYTMVIQVCLNQRSGIIDPQVLSPSRLIEILKISQDSFPRDMEVPVILNEAYAYMLLDISTVDTYLVANNLVYIVQVPLVMPSVFNVFKVIPFPMQVEGTKGNYTLIQPERELL
jgi:hypothetical protein